MAAWESARLDEIAAERWPTWAPIRHRFDIRAFGANAWRGGPGDEVIKRHSEGPDGHEELYVVLGGRATFTIAGDDVDAAAGTLIFVRDPEAERVAFAQEDGTVVLTVGGWAGRAFEPSAWETKSLS